MFRRFAYTRSILQPNEKVLFATSLHWIIFFQGAVALTLGLLLLFYGQPMLTLLGEPTLQTTAEEPLKYLTTFLTLLGLYLLTVTTLRQLGTELVLTNHRLIAKSGIISRNSYELFLTKIEGADLEQSAFGRIFGYGKLTIRGVGTNLAPLYDIANPNGFQNVLLAQLTQARAAA